MGAAVRLCMDASGLGEGRVEAGLSFLSRVLKSRVNVDASIIDRTGLRHPSASPLGASLRDDAEKDDRAVPASSQPTSAPPGAYGEGARDSRSVAYSRLLPSGSESGRVGEPA